MGSFTAGWQQTNEDTGITATSSYENTSYGVTFNVNDDLSVGYNHTESDQVKVVRMIQKRIHSKLLTQWVEQASD